MNRMFDIVVLDGCSGSYKSYTVTDCCNRFNGYVAPGVRMYKFEEDYYKPTKERTEFKINKTASKPSIYKRRFLSPCKEEYKYSFTEKTIETRTTEKDVYYNEDRDRFITKFRGVSKNTRTEYSLPRIIEW